MGVNMLKCLLRPKLAISRHFGDPPSTHVRAYGSLVNAPAVFYPSRRMSPLWIAVRPTPDQERNVLIIHKAKCARDRRLITENSAATITASRGCSDKLPVRMRNLLFGGKLTDCSAGLRMTLLFSGGLFGGFFI